MNTQTRFQVPSWVCHRLPDLYFLICEKATRMEEKLTHALASQRYSLREMWGTREQENRGSGGHSIGLRTSLLGLSEGPWDPRKLLFLQPSVNVWGQASTHRCGFPHRC